MASSHVRKQATLKGGIIPKLNFFGNIINMF